MSRLPAVEQSLFTEPRSRGNLRVMHIADAADLYLAEAARRGRTIRTRDTYRRILHKLHDMYQYADIDEVTPVMLRRFLDQWADCSPATSAQLVSMLRAFFRWLAREEIIKVDPSDRLERPRLGRPEERDELTTLSTRDVQLMLAATEGWTEKITLHVLAYTGARRRAVAQLRLRDYDRDAGELTFREKGGKTITKPIPSELRAVLDAAIASGLYETDDDYLIPGEASQRRAGDRDDRIVWKTVKRVADRVGVDAHVHAFRAAFAVYFLERKPDKLIALQSLLGHSNLETTRVYLRRLDRRRAMEEVRDLDWGSEAPAATFESFALAEKEGFEPSSDALPAPERDGTHHDAYEPLLARLRELPGGDAALVAAIEKFLDEAAARE